MIHTDNVFSYGFTQFEEECIIKLLPTKKSYLTSTECFTDIIACNSYAIFINTMMVSADDLEMLWEFYLEVSPVSETVVLVGHAEIPKQLKGRIKVFSSFEELQSDLKYILLSAYRNSKKNETFSAMLANAIMILSQIRIYPGTTTEQLAKRLEISRRSVQRYIETLRVAGEWIEYDRTLRGWKLTEGKSVLWGDL